MTDTPAQVVWTGLVGTTSGRKDPRTGQLMQYRVTLFDNGETQCSCPARLYYKSRNPEAQPGDRERYQCVHIASARRLQGSGVSSSPAPTMATDPTMATAPIKGGIAPETATDDFLSEFEDDAFLDLPQVRHVRRD